MSDALYNEVNFLTEDDQLFGDSLYRTIKAEFDLIRYWQSIQNPKSDSGIRYVPMTDEVVECFRRIIQNRKKPKVEPMIDGYVGFLFLDKNEQPMVAMHWEKYFQHICDKYNSIYKIQLPRITPHVCRHTFCSRMAAARMNPKTLQYIMGHADISVTLNTYTHLGFDDASEELERITKEKKTKKVSNVSDISTHRDSANVEKICAGAN